jgi:hypothetical protein
MSMILYVLHEDFANDPNAQDLITNPNIYRETILFQDTEIRNKRQHEYRRVFMNNVPNSSLLSSIKYIEGITWSRWTQKTGDVSLFNQIKEKVNWCLFKHIQENGEKIKVVDIRFVKFKTNEDNKNQLLLNFNIVLHTCGEETANNFHFLFAMDSKADKIEVIFLKLVGEISKHKLYVNHKFAVGLNGSKLSQYEISNYDIQTKESIDYEDTYDNILSEDERVENILYEKLMKSSLEEDPSFIQNRIHSKNQNAVRKHFMKHLAE